MATNTTNTWEMRYGGGCRRELSKIQGRRKTPSFSSSLLDAIYDSIDVSESKQQQQEEAMVVEERETENGTTAGLHGGGGGGRRRRNHATTTTTIQIQEEEEEISSLRRAIMVDKWMENYPSGSTRRKTRDNYSTRRVNSDSSSSTDSSFFSSSSETESASKSSASATIAAIASNRKHEGRFMTRTKSRALKIYGDLKKVKQPISPGGKIANFLNSIFNSNKKHHHQVVVEDEHWSSVRKSRSVNDSYSTRSCFIRQPAPALSSSSTRTKSQKRSVRFCPVGVIIDEYSQACGHTSIIYDNDPSLNLTLTPNPSNSSSRHYSYQEEENNAKKKKKKKHKYREFDFEFFNHEDEDDDDGNSCTSSDLFELENIGLIGMGTAGREELPVYGTTNLKKNQAIIYSSSQKGCV